MTRNSNNLRGIRKRGGGGGETRIIHDLVFVSNRFLPTFNFHPIENYSEAFVNIFF